MKILVLQPVPYLLEFGGLCVAQRAMCEGLVALGHDVTVVTTHAPGGCVDAEHIGHGERTAHLRHAGVDVRVVRDGVDIFDAASVAELFRKVIDETGADTFVSAEDVVAGADRPPEFGFWTSVLAGLVPPARIAYCCHSATVLPMGPFSAVPNGERQALFAQLGAIVTVSEGLKRYVGGVVSTPTEVIPYPVYGRGPFRNLADFDRAAVGIINPSPIKGASIFIALAKELRHRSFVAVPTWASSAALRAELAEMPNVRVVEPTTDRDALYGAFSILVVPSLWLEAWGLVVVEAMLRGIPVVAADHGGLPEAKLGVPYVVPVNPLTRMETSFDAVVAPPQEIGPWRDVVERLLTERAEYERVSALGRQASANFVEKLSVHPFERLLQRLGGRLGNAEREA